MKTSEAPFVDGALPVTEDHVADAESEQQLGHGDAGGAGAVDRHPQLFHATAADLAAVDQRGGDDDSGAMLVVVEDRHVERLSQFALDLEAAGRADVLEIDATEIRGDVLDDADDLVDVARGETDRKCLDAGQGLQQNRLTLHHR
ncbi:MAG: Chloramphenicol acetyltransferase [Thermomicrobiales bacterium]|nr:Chloramphenicol acetyltransferase [Thermomicrobiales bacterium]